MTTFEETHQILPVAQVIAQFYQDFPGARLTKFQLEYEGPFLKYDIVGQDNTNRYTMDINAQTGDVIKQRERALKPKEAQRGDSKALNTENLLPLSQIDEIAKDHSKVTQSFQWEMDRKGPRTIWKVELTDGQGSQVTEVKIDAHDGAVTQFKLKH